jgi:signal transduction histidine kinase/ligand-binding sensor domain-containing protein
MSAMLAGAPAPPLPFERFGLADGLSQVTIRCMLQDRTGYLWFGTQDGLNRYDGHKFQVFRNSAADVGSLPNNSIAALAEDRQGALWVATSGGGVAIWRAGGRGFERYSLADNNASALYEDAAGVMWVATQYGGVHRWNGKTFVGYPLPGLDIVELRGAPGGRLTLTTRAGAEWEFDPGTGRAAPFAKGAPWCRICPRALTDAAGDRWEATAKGLRRTQANGASTIYEHEENVPSSLSDSDVRSLLLDRSGTLWVGAQRGLNRLSPVRRRFTSFRKGLRSGIVRAFYEAEDGGLWVGTNAGLERQDGQSGEFTLALGDGVVYAIEPGPGKALWLGTADGVVEFVPGVGRRRRLLGGETIFAVRAGRGGLWIGARGGLHFWEEASGRITSYRHEPERLDSLAGNDIRALAVNGDGTVWVGTRLFGLDRLDPATGRFTHFVHRAGEANTLSGNAVYSLLPGPEGALWVGTTTGLNLWHPTKGVRRFTTIDGLPNDTINALLPGADGQVWISTNLGLSRFDLATNRFRNYTVNHGLQDNEFNGAAAHFAARTGNLYFGGINGFSRFSPAELVDRRYEPPVVLTGFQKLGQRDPEFDGARPIALSWRDPMLAFEYAALDFSAPRELRYAYLLEGFDAEWRDTDQRMATYTNLNPGTYRFRVRATNSDGIWSSQEASIRLTIQAPPWQTWWFRLGAMGLLGAGLMATYRARVQRFRRAQAAQEAFSRLLLDSQEAERKKIAADLHDSLGQNLIVIRNHALLGLAQPERPGEAEHFREIADAASLAIDEVREIATNLRPQQLERLGLLSALNAMVNRAKAASNMQWTTELEPVGEALAKEDEIHLYRIAQEAVNNILKHSQATEAAVTLARTESGFRLVIRDNGVGFALADAARQSGLGLSSLAERARILRARYHVDTGAQQGTAILLESDAASRADRHYDRDR